MIGRTPVFVDWDLYPLLRKYLIFIICFPTKQRDIYSLYFIDLIYFYCITKPVHCEETSNLQMLPTHNAHYLKVRRKSLWFCREKKNKDINSKTEQVNDRTECSSILFFMDSVVLRKFHNMRHPNGQNNYYLTNYMASKSPETFAFSWLFRKSEALKYGKTASGYTEMKVNPKRPSHPESSLSMEVACPLLSEDSSFSLLENPMITSPGEDDLWGDAHPPEDPPKLQLPLVDILLTTRANSQPVPGS